jgi:hypothetical protein
MEEVRLKMERTAVRVWKKLTREERLAAATTFWKEPPQEVAGSALGTLVRARHIRPQVARSMSAEQRAEALSGVLDPGEMVASALLVALHLGHRRALLAAFLDAMGLPHEEGVITEDEAQAAPEAVPSEKLRLGLTALRANHDAHQVETYLNTLWLQDPDRWAGLPSLE